MFIVCSLKWYDGKMGHFLSKLQEPHFQSDLSTLVGFISSKIALVGDIKLHENYFP